MIPWRDVRPGDAVRSASDLRVYEVVARNTDGTYTLRSDRREITLRPRTGDVELVARTSVHPTRAESVVSAVMGAGAEVLAEGHEGSWACPIGYRQPGALLAHLLLLHGVSGLTQTRIGEILAAHDDAHTEGQVTEAHVHVKTWRSHP